MRSVGDMGRAFSLIALAAAGCAAGDNANNACGMSVRVDVAPQMATAPALLTATSVLDDPTWTRSWTVTRASDATPIQYTALDGEQAKITVEADQGGTYHFALVVSSGDKSCNAAGDATVIAPGGKTAAYFLRVTPPVASGLPRQQRPLVLHSMTPLDHAR